MSSLKQVLRKFPILSFDIALLAILFLIYTCKKENIFVINFVGSYECLKTSMVVTPVLDDEVFYYQTEYNYDTVIIKIEPYDISNHLLTLGPEAVVIQVKSNGHFNTFQNGSVSNLKCGTTYGYFVNDSVYIEQPDFACESRVVFQGKKIAE